MKIRWKILLFALAISYASAVIGSFFTDTGGWFESIKPSITPPNIIFPIVWNILFFLIALSMYLSFVNEKKQKERNKVAFLFGANLFLNILWSIFFFGLQNPIAAFIDLILLWGSIFFLVFIVRKASKIGAYLLLPYLLWVSFAGILNFIIAF